MSALALAEDWRPEIARAVSHEVRPTEPTRPLTRAAVFEHRLATDVTAKSGPKPESILSVLIRECLQDEADPDEEAEKLLDRFGSLGGVLFASQYDLRQVIRKSEELHHLFTAVRSASAEIARSTIDLRPIISTSEEFVAFARAKIGHETRMVCCAVYLDLNMRVIEVQEHARGTQNIAEWYPREICAKALMDSCSNIILMMNVSDKNITLSYDKFDIFAKLYEMLRLIGVDLHDVLIINKSDAISFRSLGFLGDTN